MSPQEATLIVSENQQEQSYNCFLVQWYNSILRNGERCLSWSQSRREEHIEIANDIVRNSLHILRVNILDVLHIKYGSRRIRASSSTHHVSIVCELSHGISKRGDRRRPCSVVDPLRVGSRDLVHKKKGDISLLSELLHFHVDVTEQLGSLHVVLDEREVTGLQDSHLPERESPWNQSQSV